MPIDLVTTSASGLDPHNPLQPNRIPHGAIAGNGDRKLVRELRGSRFRLLRADIKAAELEALDRRAQEKVAKDREKLERMMLYGQSAACRWRLWHDYFNEEIESKKCGACDNCLHPLEEQLGVG